MQYQGRSLATIALLALAAVVSGCAFANRDRLASCEQRVQTLTAEADQLRKETLALQNRNRDLAQRAVDDARRLRDAELANRRLEKAVATYQNERKEISAAFQELQQQVVRQAQSDRLGPRAALPTPARPRPDRFEAFARAQPGTRFDAHTATWYFPAETLFRPGTAELSPRASILLDAFARLLSDQDDPAAPVLITGRAAAPPLVRTSTAEPLANSPSLGAERAERIRQELARRLELDPGSIAIAGDQPSSDSGGSHDDPSQTARLGIEIVLESANP